MAHAHARIANHVASVAGHLVRTISNRADLLKRASEIRYVSGATVEGQELVMQIDPKILKEYGGSKVIRVSLR